jgi:hypothetical protein
MDYPYNLGPYSRKVITTSEGALRPSCVISCECHHHTMAAEDLPI